MAAPRRLAGLSPDPPKSFYVPTGALPDDARNRVEPTALRDAVRHAISQPHFNLHVSGPRFSGTSTVLRAVEAAWKAHAPGGHVCDFDCAVDALPFSPQFRWNMGDKNSLPEKDEEPGRERVKNTLARLTGELAVELDLPGLTGNFAVPRELFVAVRSQLKALENTESTPHRRLVILDGLDPTDVPLAKALSEVAVGLNDLRTGPRGISVVVGTSYSADLLGKLEPSPRSSSHWLSERFHPGCTDGFSREEANNLADTLSDGNPKLRTRLFDESEKPDLPGHQPILCHEAMRYLRERADGVSNASALVSIFDEMRAGAIKPATVPAGIRAFLSHLESLNGVLEKCRIGKDGEMSAESNAEQRTFASTFLRSAGWFTEGGGKRNYRWQSLEDAWNVVKS